MKILLIKPNWWVERQVVSPPLGVMYLAAVVKLRITPAPDVEIIDLGAQGVSLQQLESKIEKEKPDIIGISALTYVARAVKLIAESIGRVSPGTPIIVGGPHASIFYDHLLKSTPIDIAVIGEGEVTFVDLVEKIRDGRDWRDTLGIAYRNENGEIIKNSPQPAIADLDGIPLPAWDLIDIPIYNKFGDMNGYMAAWPHMPIFTSRACPYGCIYCHQIFGKKFRARSVESTVEEIRTLVYDHGIKEIHIVDDIFNWDIDRAKNICRAIIKEGIKVKIAFPNGIRGDKLDEELIELLAEAGCYSMTFAVETASPRIQKLLRKFADLEKLERLIAKAYDAGILTFGFFMLGFPTETREEMEDTIDFACRSKMLKAVFFSVVPYPRTKMYDLFKETYPDFLEVEGDELENMHFFTPQAFYTKSTGIDLTEVVRHAYRKFYLRPFHVIDMMIRFQWNRRLLRGFYHGFRAVWAPLLRIEDVRSNMRNRMLGMEKTSKQNLP